MRQILPFESFPKTMYEKYFDAAIASHIRSNGTQMMMLSKLSSTCEEDESSVTPSSSHNENSSIPSKSSFVRELEKHSLNDEEFKHGFEGVEYENIPVPNARRSVNVFCSRSPSQDASHMQHMPWDYNSEIMSTDEYIDPAAINAKAWDLTNDLSNLSTNLSTVETLIEKAGKVLKSMSPDRVPKLPAQRQNLNAPIHRPNSSVPLAQQSVPLAQNPIHPQQSQIPHRYALYSNPSATNSDNEQLLHELLMKFYWAGYRAGCTER